MDMEVVNKNNKRKNYYLRWISLLPALVMMVVIFLFSAKPAEISDETSTPIAKTLLKVWEYSFGEIKESVRMDWLDTANFIVRKMAHVTEYTMLALCISWPFWIRGLRGKKFIGMAFLSGVTYAATDEFHQLFDEGRSGRMMDVGIDAIGCAIGSILFYLVAKKIGERAKQKQIQC